mmetsp:Transcript_13735/g.39565  ORF Transcript_13735/g.39565 Transcript_13735/m.39565 type:complete len:153 (-) Transcript_13735:1369-1827(-)
MHPPGCPTHSLSHAHARTAPTTHIRPSHTCVNSFIRRWIDGCDGLVYTTDGPHTLTRPIGTHTHSQPATQHQDDAAVGRSVSQFPLLRGYRKTAQISLSLKCTYTHMDGWMDGRVRSTQPSSVHPFHPPRQVGAGSSGSPLVDNAPDAGEIA